LARALREGKRAFRFPASPFLRRFPPDACLALVKELTENHLLKGVSRSFYLSLRLLPRPMRGAASLGYLLARVSDTLADTATAPAAARLSNLEAFSRAISGMGRLPQWDVSIINSVTDLREKSLLESTDKLSAWLERLPQNEAALVREVVGIIISGQKLDIERFGSAIAGHPVCLADDAELEDYTWRVAGCVGAFWTKLGFLTLGGSFSKQAPDPLITQGITYGKGLQLVNILRDMAADLAMGRSYLPVAARERWINIADDRIGEGFKYAEALDTRRLRAASVLPAMLARETLKLLHQAGPEAMKKRVKVPRRHVYLSLLRAFMRP